MSHARVIAGIRTSLCGHNATYSPLYYEPALRTGLEPATHGLKVHNSTYWATEDFPYTFTLFLAYILKMILLFSFLMSWCKYEVNYKLSMGLITVTHHFHCSSRPARTLPNDVLAIFMRVTADHVIILLTNQNDPDDVTRPIRAKQQAVKGHTLLLPSFRSFDVTTFFSVKLTQPCNLPRSVNKYKHLFVANLQWISVLTLLKLEISTATTMSH